MKYSQFTSACVMQLYLGRLMIVVRLHEKTNIFCTPFYVDFFRPTVCVLEKQRILPYLSQINIHSYILLLLYNQ
jgi:hypothetical protein